MLSSPLCIIVWSLCALLASSTCPAGQGDDGADGCTACPAGKAGTGCGDTCQPGKYSLSGDSACRDCPNGTYGLPGIKGLPTAECSGLCMPGRYSQAGYTACEACPVGKYGHTAGLGSSDCSGVCPVGKYADEVGRVACDNCDAGR